MRAAGHTLIEMVLSMFMVAVILSACAVLLVTQQNNSEKPRAAMAAEEDVLHVVRTLQQDLEETDVQSIRSFPAGSDTAAGLSLESPRTLSGSTVRDAQVGGPSGSLDVGVFGVVRWHKFVYYHLVSTGAQAGTLERFEGPLSDAEMTPAGDSQHRVPVPSSVLPSVGPASRQNGHVLSQRVVLPGATVKSGNGGVLLPPGGLSDYDVQSGGFHVFWKDAAGALHPFADAPGAGAPPVRGDPVFVELYVQDVSPRTGHQTLVHYEMQVHPRN